MKWLWAHRYSSLSIGFSVCNFFFVYGALNEWFWRVVVVPHTELYRVILSVYGSLVIGSLGMATLAITKERPQILAILAFGVGSMIFFIAGMSMAV